VTRIVTPQEFVDVFQGVIDSEPGIAGTWDSPPEYTALLLKQDGAVLKRVAEKLELSYWPELMNIDACLYQGAREPFLVSIAIEHENLVYTSFREANKLALLAVPLKVLLTYPQQQRQDPEFLKEYEKIVVACAASVGGSTPGRFLVILAWREGGVISWRYYQWSEDGFVSIEPESRHTSILRDSESA
jgi:hypothetical protein